MRDPATAVEPNDVVLHLNDALRTFCITSLEKVNARAFSHIDGGSTLLGLSFIDPNSTHKDGPNRFTPEIAHRSQAAPGDAYWVWPEEQAADDAAAEREVNKSKVSADFERPDLFDMAVRRQFRAVYGEIAEFGNLSTEDFAGMTVEAAAVYLKSLMDADDLMQQAEAEDAARSDNPSAS